MKKTITLMALAAGLLSATAQTTVEGFESFTLTANSAYSPTVSTPFQGSNGIFSYKYSGYWSGGFAYTNVLDSVTPGYTNAYGIRAYKGYNNSANFAVMYGSGKITLTAPQTTVSGFYITNTTYAYKSMASGDQFAKKFGGTSGNDPDFFKVIVKGYKNGVLKTDSVTAMLADFTFTNNTQDYILNTWQFVNTSVIGEVDSLKFFFRSSDMGAFGINTPVYFAMDDFTTINAGTTGIAKQAALLNTEVYPNPFNSQLTIVTSESSAAVRVMSVDGKTVLAENLSGYSNALDLGSLQNGVYFIELRAGDKYSVSRIVKN